MTSFTGVIRLAADPETTILADMDVFEDRLVLSASGSEIGAWDRDVLALEPTPHGFTFVADGEEIIIEPADVEGFAGAMGVEASKVRDTSKRSDDDLFHAAKLAPGTLLDAEPNDDVDTAWVHEQAATFGSLRERSAAEWHESDTIDRPVLLTMGVALVLTVLGVVLGWGDGNLFMDDFPVQRVLFGLVGLTIVAAIYMAISQTQERQVVGLTLLGAGIIGLLVLWLWGRTTGVAVGYLVGTVGATVAIIAGILAAADWGWVVFPHKAVTEPETAPAKKKRGFFKRLLRRR